MIMKTIIKIPVYVEIGSPEGTDRKAITEAVKEFLKPEILEQLKSGNTPRYFSNSAMKNFHKKCGEGSSYRFVSEFEIFKQPNFSKSDHTFIEGLNERFKGV